MTGGVDRTRVEMLRQEYERQVARIQEMKTRMSEVSATAVSPRRELSITVGRGGVVTDVKFLTSGYRQMTKNEISELVQRTLNEAREKLNDQAAELMQPMMPGVDAKAMMNGNVDVSALAADRLPEVVRERLDRQA
jgi:DNA-binding protein YbaB